MADESTGTPADANAEAQRLFGEGTPPASDSGTPGALPAGYIEKYWNAAKGDAAEYAKVLSEGYRQLNGTYTQVTQSLGEDKPGEVAEAYWADRTKAGFEEKYPKLSFDDEEAVRDIYRAAHAQGLGPKRANALVDHYLEARNKGAPEVEDDETRRSRVIHELGPQGAQKASAVASWVMGGKLTADQVKALAPVAETKDGIEALFALSRAGVGQPPAGDPAVATAGVELAREAELAQLKADLADPVKGHSAEVRARYMRLVKPGKLLNGDDLPQVRGIGI